MDKSYYKILVTGARSIKAIDSCTAPNGDVYACSCDGRIVRKASGTDTFFVVVREIEYEPRPWVAICAAPNGDIYAAVYGGDIYLQLAGTVGFFSLGQTARLWCEICAESNGDICACAVWKDGSSDVFKRVAGVGNFICFGDRCHLAVEKSRNIVDWLEDSTFKIH